MKRKVIGRVFAAVAVGAMMTASFAGTASAEAVVPMHQDWPDSHDWRDPGAPWGVDRHCDRHGFWHDHDHDQFGHPDGRCHPW
ncbi:hypothetical protein [Nocardia sp. NPDC051570]|uniref:hypothetical protein n=1 Tax=Nocardia sp. NPDC051570 TaxID=3364324 RepID=UPI0037A30E99